jgi:hypothetical protein
MVEVLTRILDRMIQLLNTRAQGKADVFEDHIEPVFRDLSAVHRDYLETFTHLLDLCEQRNSCDSVICFLKSRKPKLEQLRAKVFAYADAARNRSKLPDDVRSFFQECLAYFNNQYLTVRWSKYEGQYSNLLKLIEDGVYIVPPKSILDKYPAVAGDCLLSLVKWRLDRVRSQWDVLCRAYSDLKLTLSGQ